MDEMLLEGQAWRVFNAFHEMLKKEKVHAEDHVKLMVERAPHDQV